MINWCISTNYLIAAISSWASRWHKNIIKYTKSGRLWFHSIMTSKIFSVLLTFLWSCTSTIASPLKNKLSTCFCSPVSNHSHSMFTPSTKFYLLEFQQSYYSICFYLSLHLPNIYLSYSSSSYSQSPSYTALSPFCLLTNSSCHRHHIFTSIFSSFISYSSVFHSNSRMFFQILISLILFAPDCTCNLIYSV